VSTLNAIVTHLEAEHVHESLGFLHVLSEDARFVVCHGGDREQFKRIEVASKIFVDDPTLRGPARHLQSWTRIFELVWDEYFTMDPGLDSLYLFEYDHLVLARGFEARLRELAAATGADFMGKNCVDRTSTNWEHYVRFREDERLLAHLRALSVRDDRERLFGCLGNGMWLSRGALKAYVEVGRHPPCYCETYVPTLLHHLGFRVVDVDAHGDLYRYVRWLPIFSAEEAIELALAGAVFVHPVKDLGATRALRDVLVERG
jgi:hypothetical protein